MVNASYTAESIEVLSGLDPVKKRPGMYTDTTRPNHLAHEIIDNSVTLSSSVSRSITIKFINTGAMPPKPPIKNLLRVVSIFRILSLLRFSYPILQPNAGPQPRPEAAATQERRLLGVGCRPMLGRLAADPRLVHGQYVFSCLQFNGAVLA